MLEGEIGVLGLSLLPIAVGEVGPSINYEANITERDVFTVNGVLHYIDSVIVDAPPPDPPDLDVVCRQEKCLADPNQPNDANFLRRTV